MGRANLSVLRERSEQKDFSNCTSGSLSSRLCSLFGHIYASMQQMGEDCKPLHWLNTAYRKLIM